MCWLYALHTGANSGHRNKHLTFQAANLRKETYERDAMNEKRPMKETCWQYAGHTGTSSRPRIKCLTFQEQILAQRVTANAGGKKSKRPQVNFLNSQLLSQFKIEIEWHSKCNGLHLRPFTLFFFCPRRAVGRRCRQSHLECNWISRLNFNLIGLFSTERD